jgi:adenylate kinase
VSIFKAEVFFDVEVEDIEEIVETNLSDIFADVHSIMRTKSGDITPKQNERLDKIKADLVVLVIEQAKQNI